jgi:hypothetical protein
MSPVPSPYQSDVELRDPWVPDGVCETHEWRSTTGEVIRFVTEVDAEQRMMMPVEIHTVRVPLAAGGRYRLSRHEERVVTLPVVVPGAQNARAELRRWASALDPLKGEGTLTVIHGPHAGRQLVCVYEGGLDDYEEPAGPFGKTTLAFRAAEPYWQDSTESSISAGVESSAVTWFPFLPLVLGSSDVFASATIDNIGDVDAWPIVTVMGPGGDLTVENQTSGLAWQMTGTIDPGSTLVVDTRPGHKSVRLDGANVFRRLTESSVLWPLIPGLNRVAISFAGAGAEANVTFAWRNRWLSA